MKIMNNKLEKLKEGIALVEKFHQEVEQSFVKIGQPAIYEDKFVLPKAFIFNRETQKTEVMILYVDTDDNGETDSQFEYRWKHVNATIELSKLAPYTEASKLLFTKE